MTKLVALIIAMTPALANADKSYNDGTGGAWDCKKDPTIYINHGGGKYTFTGACKAIYVNGGGVTADIESVDELAVNGAKNIVTVGAIDKLNVNGAGNKVTWKKAKSSDKPAVNANGADNKIDQAK